MATARPLLLVGAGGLAREVLAAVRADPSPRYRPIGALDDRSDRHGTEIDGLPVLGYTAAVHDHPDAAVVLCVANAHRPGDRIALADRLALPSDRFATIVHPAASVPAGSELGPGTVLLAAVVLSAPLSLGAYVLAMPHVLLTHDNVLAAGVTLAGRATLAGGVDVGTGAYLGQGAMVRENLKIGADAVIGMGSVVLQDVPPGERWAGVPARRLGARP